MSGSPRTSPRRRLRLLLLVALGGWGTILSAPPDDAPADVRVPLLYSTDLFHPHDDPEDPIACLTQPVDPVRRDALFGQTRNLWCTAVFRSLTRPGVPHADPFAFEPVRVEVEDDATVRSSPTEPGRTVHRFRVRDPENYAAWMTAETARILAAFPVAPADDGHGGIGTAPLGPPGWVAEYRLGSDPADRPPYEREQRLTVLTAELELGPVVERVAERPLQWCGLAWTRQNGARYQAWILMDGWPTRQRSPEVPHYLWREPGWPDFLGYTHAVTGETLLPRLPFWDHAWPRARRGELEEPAGWPASGAPERIWLQGWPFALTSFAPRADRGGPPSTWTTLRLNPDLLIGWTPLDRDVAGRPFYRLPDQAYAYTAKTPEDLLADLASGANFFVSHPRRGADDVPAWLTRAPVYHNNLARRPLDWPADLYRPNYWGYGNHIDEPGVHNWGLELRTDPDAAAPEIQAVRSLERLVRQGVERRGQSAINAAVSRNFGLGTLHLTEDPSTLVTWEYEWSTAWYQLAVENGVGGMVDEDATLNDLVEAYNMAFDTRIPPTVENACTIRVAVLRGAARNFGKRWGVAFYHPNEVKLKSASIPILYEKGASYFWAWSGWVGITDNSGLPHPYQRYYNTLVRSAFDRQPDRDMPALLQAAKVAVMLPYGYTFTPYALHRIPWLHLEQRNAFGVRHRQVLARAALEVERLLRAGIEFDIVVDDPQFRQDGYEEVIRIQADGRLRLDRHDAPPQWLAASRPLERPDLGPEPRLWLEWDDSETAQTGELRFRAVGRLGTGDWAAEQPEARVGWEVYGPDGRVTPAVFPEYGAERTLRLDPAARHRIEGPLSPAAREQIAVEGAFTVRAAMADVFGRPAITYVMVHLETGHP